MSELESGAKAIEKRVRALAAGRGVMLVRIRWNGDEGLAPNGDTQTLFLSGTQKEARATLSTDEIEEYEQRGDTAKTDAVLREAVADLHAADTEGRSPVGGGGQ